jgi:hypothetical protein
MQTQHELLQLLGSSVTCAILGKAGPQRSRILGTLHKDERKASLETLGKNYSAHAKARTGSSSPNSFADWGACPEAWLNGPAPF